MKIRGYIVSIILLWASLHVQSSWALLSGTIRGTVVDENGAPVSAAQVRADPLAEGPRSEIVRVVKTDRIGQFSMTDLELTTYKVFAMKESAGYPNTAAAFYSNNIFPTVTLSASVPVASIVLKMGPPAAVITGTITDAVTNRPLNVTVLLRRSLDPNKWISTGERSAYRVLVPPDVDVFMEVTAPDHRTWYYGGPSDPLKRAPIRLQSGKEMKLDIQLEPEEKSKNPE